MKRNSERPGQTVWMVTMIGFALLLLFAAPQRAVAQWGANGNNISNTNTGNVGIGTASPDKLLTVQGTGAMSVFRTTGSNNGAGLLMDATGTGNNNIGFSLSGVTKGAISWDNSRSFLGLVNLAYSPNDFSLRLNSDGSLTYHDSASAAERFRITAAGNVGIGTASPGKKLEILATDGEAVRLYRNANNVGWGVNMKFAFNNSNNVQVDYAGVHGVVQANTAGEEQGVLLFTTATSGSLTEKMRIDASGNVGIGTTTPSASLLHLQSASHTYLRIGAPLAYQSSIAFNDDANGQDIVLYRPESTRDFSIWTATAGNVVRVTQGGSVGIGTAAPAYKLDVNGEINATGLRINGTPISTGGGSSQWTTSGTSIYYSSGSVGIGTTSPAFDANAAKYLTVDAGAAAIGSIGAAGGTGSTGTAVSQVAFVNSSLGTTEKRLATIVGSTDAATNSGMLDFYTATAGAFSSSRMRITSGGNVGIGITTPGSKLDVAGTIRGGNADTNIGNHPSYGTTYGAFWRQGADYSLLTDGTNTFLNAPVATGNVYFRSANADRMFLQGSTGNVGIGTTAPATKLHVVGDVTVTGNIAAKYQDVAEWVESSQQLSAGTVVVLDATQSNQVVASTQAYDTRVAGVISERPGLVLGESGINKVLVATTGRVKIKVDATLAPICVGDLLVTGNQAGVAMKSQPLDLGGVPIHRPGTLIGKALEPLAKGQGQILALLSLQ